MMVHPILAGLETLCVLSSMHHEAVNRAREHSELKYCVFWLWLHQPTTSKCVYRMGYGDVHDAHEQLAAVDGPGWLPLTNQRLARDCMD